jgi:hypothetical protein
LIGDVWRLIEKARSLPGISDFQSLFGYRNKRVRRADILWLDSERFPFL